MYGWGTCHGLFSQADYGGDTVYTSIGTIEISRTVLWKNVRKNLPILWQIKRSPKIPKNVEKAKDVEYFWQHCTRVLQLLSVPAEGRKLFKRSNTFRADWECCLFFILTVSQPSSQGNWDVGKCVSRDPTEDAVSNWCPSRWDSRDVRADPDNTQATHQEISFQSSWCKLTVAIQLVESHSLDNVRLYQLCKED